MIIPPRVLVQVALRMLSGHGVVHTADAALHKAPKALDGVDVGIALNVDLGLVAERKH
jgi:hypothetical protein